MNLSVCLIISINVILYFIMMFNCFVIKFVMDLMMLKEKNIIIIKLM